MAEEKIPSPQEIKSEVVKFTKEELESLQNFQTKSEQTILQLGRIHLSQIRLKEQEDIIKSQIKELEKSEQELAQKLSDKYGRGSLDIETGTFTPVK